MQSLPAPASFCFFTGSCLSALTSFSTATAQPVSDCGAFSAFASLDPLLSSTAGRATIGNGSDGCSLSLLTLEEESR
uniref:Putative secreted protein n=1 Tax=Anopheles marajoara TaxID=58244 RepID=A0A2M4CD44_9DIPT